MTNAPQVGDTITVQSVVGQYNGTAQLKNAVLISTVEKEWTDAEKAAYDKENTKISFENSYLYIPPSLVLEAIYIILFKTYHPTISYIH